MRKTLDCNIIPKRYKLHINVGEDTFTGSVEVYATVANETDNFSVNSVDLAWTNTYLIHNGENIFLKNVYNDQEVAIFTSRKLSKKDEVIFKTEFSGKYSESLEGFYKSNYNNKTIYSTKFEPTHARKAFPCWDQPDIKATFEISISAPEGTIAISNSELVSCVENTYTFQIMPPMSTYLVGYVIGPFSYLEKKTKNDVPVRVYMDENERSWGKYALNVAVECLEFFEKYFEIEYPLPKLDLVTIPSFASGAMENWGIITFRKSVLLFDDASSSIRSKKIIASVVCHEIAHMWFGNIVTMKWWNDLWLNEGFATWASALAMSKLSKNLVNWDVWTEFINDNYERGMNYDGLKSTHPIEVDVNNPSEINQIFDEISYSKGSSIIRMLENFIGEEAFRQGVVKYLKKHIYSNAESKDLWNAFDTSLEVKELMENWIKQDGFPLLIVEEKNDKLVLKQKRFTYGNVGGAGLWKIPIEIAFNGQEIKKLIMSTETMEIQKENDVYKINHGAYGFYRVCYEGQNFAKLLEIKLSSKDRLNLINDYFEMARALYLPVTYPLSVVELFAEETEYEILYSILNHLYNIKSIFYDDENILKHINLIIGDIVNKRVENIDLLNSGSTPNEASLNIILLLNAIQSENEKLKERFKKSFESYKTEKKSICPEFRRAMFIANVDDNLDDIFGFFENSDSYEEKLDALYSLGQCSSKSKLLGVLDKINQIESHNTIYIFASLSTNIKNRAVLMDYFIENWKTIKSHVGNSRLFARIMELMVSVASTEEYLWKISKMFNDVKDETISRTITKVLDKIKARILYRNQNSELHAKK